MKKSILIFAFFIFTFPLISQEGRIYIEKPANNGQWVDKSETWYEYSKLSKKVHKNDYIDGEEWLEYDNNNNLIYRKHGSIEEWYDYDDHNTLYYTKYKYSANDIRETRLQHTYNEKGQLIYTIDPNLNKDFSNYEQWYEYDERGNLVHYKNSHSEQFFEYDENNNKVSEKFYYWVTTFKYDSRGNKIYSNMDGREEWFAYDSHNNLIYSYEGEDEKWFEYEYDDNGNVTHKVSKYYTMAYGETGYRYRKAFNCRDEWFEYDKYNNVIHYKDSTTFEKWYEYEYDSKGRIVHEICYSRN